jgi:acetaldehyde dehydrogenase (acetylating)
MDNSSMKDFSAAELSELAEVVRKVLTQMNA